MLVDNELFSITVIGFEKTFIFGDTINAMIKNKTEQTITVKVEDASVNGLYHTFVNLGATAMYPMTLFDGVSPEG